MSGNSETCFHNFLISSTNLNDRVRYWVWLCISRSGAFQIVWVPSLTHMIISETCIRDCFSTFFPPFPTMQLTQSQLRFECVVLVAVNVASNLQPQAEMGSGLQGSGKAHFFEFLSFKLAALSLQYKKSIKSQFINKAHLKWPLRWPYER